MMQGLGDMAESVKVTKGNKQTLLYLLPRQGLPHQDGISTLIVT